MLNSVSILETFSVFFYNILKIDQLFKIRMINMPELIDYINWRGDIPCSISPYNNADYYIISKIGCPDFDNIVPANASSISLQDTVSAYFFDGQPLGLLTSKYILDAFKILPYTERFQDIRLSGFSRIANDENIEQFSALSLMLPDGTVFVSFRGTDDTLTAWREDMQMAVKEIVPAQNDALKYLKWAAESYSGPLVIGGHSKGGNMAVFAASMAPEEIQKRITAIYSFDGPGFRTSFYEQSGYKAICEKVHEVVPQTSLVGMLLNKERPLEIISCYKNGIASHDGYQWETSPVGFVAADSLSAPSLAVHDASNEIMEEMTAEEIRQFIDETFNILQEKGASTLTDLSEQHLLEKFDITRHLNSSKSVKGFSIKMLECIIKCLASNTIPQKPQLPFEHLLKHTRFDSES